MNEMKSGAATCCGMPDDQPAEVSCSVQGSATMDQAWVDGSVSTAAGDVARVTTALGFEDTLGSWKARWGIGRMHYIVAPGLYAVGSPTPESPVFVTANYKMSFDRLRAQLTGRDGWILVLDTDGINVWCAAGKGTFGTDELVRRIEAARLAEVVSHKKLILPQLGAPGVSAHEVKKRSKFSVVYGPVRAEDLPAYLDAGMKATPAMRRVEFPFRDRVVLIPMELVPMAGYSLAVVACLFLLAGLGSWGYSIGHALTGGFQSAILFFAAYVAGAALTPALLPWLPGRAFSSKGAWAGLAVAAVAGAYAWFLPGLFEGALSAAAWFLIIPAVASFMAMNFTGASTYTSLSGVVREMKVAIPLQIVCAIAGLGLWVTARFV